MSSLALLFDGLSDAEKAHLFVQMTAWHKSQARDRQRRYKKEWYAKNRVGLLERKRAQYREGKNCFAEIVSTTNDQK